MFALVVEHHSYVVYLGDEDKRVFGQSLLGYERKQLLVVVFHMRNAPPRLRLDGFAACAFVGNGQRRRGYGVAMRVEKRVAQQRCNAFLLVGRDAVFHAMRPFVPLGRCITRVFGQVLFVDAVGANKPKGVHATLFGKYERVVGS